MCKCLLPTLTPNCFVPTGAVWQVEGCETVFTVAQELSAIANKTVHPYEVIKYNIEVNPARLRPGTILVVPLARGKYTVGVVTIQLGGVTQLCQSDVLTCIDHGRHGTLDLSIIWVWHEARTYAQVSIIVADKSISSAVKAE